MHADFGYFPEPLKLTAGHISISTRQDLDESIQAVRTWPTVDGDWIYDPGKRRVFPLPKTHKIGHLAADGPEHLDFLVWALSFFVGMRLTTTEAGFVDATPIKRQALVDFGHLSHSELERALSLAEDFWQTTAGNPRQRARWVGAVHLTFLAWYPRAMQYERFIYLYSAIDACFAMLKAIHPPSRQLLHNERIDWMCGKFGMPIPKWAKEVADLRNDLIHEGLYVGVPLGFASHDRISAENLPLEMGNLARRFLVAIIGGGYADYVRVPVSIYQLKGLAL